MKLTEEQKKQVIGEMAHAMLMDNYDFAVAVGDFQLKAGLLKEDPSCYNCKYEGRVREKIIDYDTGETMMWGSCLKHAFCDGTACVDWEPKKGDGNGNK